MPDGFLCQEERNEFLNFVTRYLHEILFEWTNVNGQEYPNKP